MTESPALLTVVEFLPGHTLSKYIARIYDVDFWKPLLPLHMPIFEKISPTSFKFQVDDQVILDPTGYLSREFRGEGTIEVTDLGEQGEKGYLWQVKITLILDEMTTLTNVLARVRARDDPSNHSLKVGIFLFKLDYPPNLQNSLSQDAIFFGIRVYLRQLLQKAAKLP
jgi:hypothetical protein